MVKQHYGAGVKGLLVADGLGWSSNWYEMTGEASNGAISMDSPRTLTDEQKKWSERFKSAYGAEPSPAASGHAYDYTRMLIKGLSSAGTLEKGKLSDTLLNSEYKGVWQYYSFAKKPGDGAVSAYEVKAGPFMKGFSFPMVQYFDGKDTVVWPTEFAQGEFKGPAN